MVGNKHMGNVLQSLGLHLTSEELDQFIREVDQSGVCVWIATSPQFEEIGFREGECQFSRLSQHDGMQDD